MDSHCIYCNSKYYGRPCLYSPTKTHVHFDAPNKCVFCGSKVIGSGCPYNPFSKIHIRGPEFLTNVKESVEKSVILKYLYETVSNFTESAVQSPLNRFFKRLSAIIFNSGEPLLEALQLQETKSYAELTKEQNLVAFELKERLSEQYKELIESAKYAHLALPKEVIEKILLDVIMSNKNEE